VSPEGNCNLVTIQETTTINGGCDPTFTCQTNGQGKVGAGIACQFPFEYNGVHYDTCTTVDESGTMGELSPWCLTNDAYSSFGYCDCTETTQEDTGATTSTGIGKVSTLAITTKNLATKLSGTCTDWVPSPCTFTSANIYWNFPSGSQYESAKLWDYSNLYRKQTHSEELSQCASICSMDPKCHAYLIDTTTKPQPLCQLHTFTQGATVTGSAFKATDYPLYGNVKQSAKSSLGLLVHNNHCAAYPASFGSDLPSACPACPEKTYWLFDTAGLPNGYSTGTPSNQGKMTLTECTNVCASIGSLWRNKGLANFDGTEYCDAVLINTNGECITWMLGDDLHLRASCGTSQATWYGKVNEFAISTAGKGLTVVGDDSCTAGTPVVAAGAPGAKCTQQSDCTTLTGMVHGVCAGGFCQNGRTDNVPNDGLYIPPKPRGLCNQDSDCYIGVCTTWQDAKNLEGFLNGVTPDTRASPLYFFGTCASQTDVAKMSINRHLNGVIAIAETVLHQQLLPNSITLDQSPIPQTTKSTCALSVPLVGCVLKVSYSYQVTLKEVWNLQSITLGIGLGAIGGSLLYGKRRGGGNVLDLDLEVSGSPHLSAGAGAKACADGVCAGADVNVAGHLAFDSYLMLSGNVKPCPGGPTGKGQWNSFDISLIPSVNVTNFDIVMDQISVDVTVVGIKFPIPINFASIANKFIQPVVKKIHLQEKVTQMVNNALQVAIKSVSNRCINV
jgi:hypothetical protein